MKYPLQPILPASRAETMNYLRSVTPEDQQMMLDLWNNHSGASGLLAAGLSSSARTSLYTYNPITQTYTHVGTGRKVTDEQLRVYVRRVSVEAKARMRKETQQLIAGAILLAVWYSRTRSLMKALYKTVFIISIGGFLFDDDVARNLFYWLSLIQFDRHDNFLRQIGLGTQPLNGRATARAGMYASWANTFHQNIRLDRAEDKGFNEVCRILGENENHCHDSSSLPGCVELAEEGWMPIKKMTPMGGATCYSECQCSFHFRNFFPGRIERRSRVIGGGKRNV